MSGDNIQQNLRKVLERKQKNIDEGDTAQCLRNQRAKVGIESEKQQQKLKEGYARWAKWTVSLWLIFIGLVICSVGFEWLAYSDGVLITLFATTTINVLALSLVIIRGLFSPNEKQ